MVLDKVIDIIDALMHQGKIGLALAVLFSAIVTFIWWKFSDILKETAHKDTEKGRVDDQSGNASENAEAEKDADKAKDEIDKIIEKGDN